MSEETFVPSRRRAVATEEAPEAEVDESAPKQAPSQQAFGLRRGWSASQQVMEQGSDYAQALKVESDVQIIKFLEDDPYVSYARHWVQRSGPNGNTTRPYVCLNSLGKDCPLCDIGDRPQSVSAFNVALLTDDGHALLRSWDVGVRVNGSLRNFATDQKIGPLTKGYFGVSKSGKGTSTSYQIIPIRSDNTLSEEWDVEMTPELEAEITTMEPYTADIIQIPKTSEMKEIAAELADSDEYA